MITAKTAKKLTEGSIIKNVTDRIEKACREGKYNIRTSLTDFEKDWLENNGYKVTSRKNESGLEHFEVQWD